MSLEETYRLIDSQAADYIRDLVTLIQQPSISAKSEGIQECAALVESMLKKARFRTKILQKGKMNPVVFGELKSTKSRRTLLFYNHYDVQPPEPFEEWTFEPFSGMIEKSKIYGRGASDNKGNFVSRLKAVEAILEVTNDMPANIKFVVEGEEEIGSPNLEPVVASNTDLLFADAAIWEFGGVDRQGRPNLYLGLKGVLSVELRATEASKDAHSANAPLIPNAAWLLVWTLSHLKDQEENILIEDFYQKVRPPSPEEIECLQDIPFEEEEIKEEFSIKELLKNKSGSEALEALLYQPTCSINGLISGYTGKGGKTVLPHEATVKLDFRLVPDQNPDEIFMKLTQHLEKLKTTHVEIIRSSSTEPARTAIDDPFVKLVSRTAEKVYGKKAIIYPTSAGSGPLHLFRNFLGYPVVSVGCSHPEANTHAPDENLQVDSFIKGAKFIATLIEDFASN